MRRQGAFTLLEVIVAGGLLAIGVLSLTMLQAQALQVQRRVAVMRELVAVAEAELYRSLALPTPVAGECVSAQAKELTDCEVETVSCPLSSAALCGGLSGRATSVRVVVERGGQEFVLSAIHARFAG